MLESVTLLEDMSLNKSLKIRIARKSFFSCGYREQGSFKGGNFELEVGLEGSLDPKTGMVVNLTDFDAILKEVVSLVDHKFLEEVPQVLQGKSYSVIRLALFLKNQVVQRLTDSKAHLCFLELRDGPDLSCRLEEASA